MAKKALIMGGFDGKQERIAMECDSVEEATNRLNKAFAKVSENLWVDRCGQEFSIKIDQKTLQAPSENREGEKVKNGGRKL